MNRIALNEADNGRPIELHVGDVLNVTLEENPTTGFLWAADVSDRRVLEEDESEYSPVSTAGIGGGGSRTLIFRAVAPGECRISATHMRSWEGEASALGRFAVAVHVV